MLAGDLRRIGCTVSVILGLRILELLVLGCSSGFGGVVGEAAAVTVVGARNRGGIGPGRHIRSLAGRWGRWGSRALDSRSGVGRRLCRRWGSILARRSGKIVAVLVVPCSVSAEAGRIDMASWSCTGLDIPGDKAGCVQRLARQQADLCVVVEVVALAAAVPMTNRSTLCLSRLAAD